MENLSQFDRLISMMAEAEAEGELRVLSHALQCFSNAAYALARMMETTPPDSSHFQQQADSSIQNARRLIGAVK